VSGDWLLNRILDLGRNRSAGNNGSSTGAATKPPESISLPARIAGELKRKSLPATKCDGAERCVMEATRKPDHASRPE